MNKLNLFLIMSIGAVFATASIFGSTMTTAFAQGNDTGEVQVGPPLVFTAENATLAGNATNATTAAAGDSVVGQTPQVDAAQNEATSDSGDQTSDGETSDNENEGSDNENEGSDNENEGSDNENEGSDGGDEGSDNENENNN